MISLHPLDLGMVIEEYDLLRSKQHFLPEFSEAPGIVRVDDDPEIARVPEFDFGGAE